MNKDKKHTLALERYATASESWQENRDNALEDIKFARLSQQWPDDVKRQRENDSRPCLTINRLPAFIRQVVNDARLNTPSIKVHPSDDNADPETAEIVNGIIRNIETSSNAEVAYDSSLEDAVTGGFGFFRIDLDYAHDDAFDLDIQINRIANPLSVYPDPHSEEIDASDWSYCFVEDELSKSEFKAAYPKADISNWDGDSDGWVSEDTVRICEYWVREEVDTELLLLSDGSTLHEDQYVKNKHLFDAQGLTIAQTRPSKTFKVKQYILSGAEIIEETSWPGRFIPIVPVYGDEIYAEGKRHFQGLIRPAKDVQRNYNYWRTAATEKVALATKAPWIGPVGAFDSDARKWETANTETHAFIEYDGPMPPQQIMPSVADAGALQEALNASDDLKSIMGLHDASLGAKSNEVSGKAIMARQREGDVSTFHFIDNLSRGIRYAGRVLLDLIPKVYTKPRVMRIMGYDGTPENVQVNKEFDVNGITKMHDLTAGKYDLVVKTGPSFTSKREEAATQMTEMIRAFPDAAPIIGDLVAKNLDWPGADEIAKRLKTLLPPEIQAMEKMDGLPPEAQAAMANAQQQIKQYQQLVDQGKQMLGDKDQEIKDLSTQLKDKQAEISVKSIDSERKYNLGMAKITMDSNTEERRIIESQRELIVDTTIEALKMRIESMANPSDELTTLLSQMNEEKTPCTKTVEITAPSGEVYSGTVTG